MSAPIWAHFFFIRAICSIFYRLYFRWERFGQGVCNLGWCGNARYYVAVPSCRIWNGRGRSGFRFPRKCGTAQEDRRMTEAPFTLLEKFWGKQTNYLRKLPRNELEVLGILVQEHGNPSTDCRNKICPKIGNRRPLSNNRDWTVPRSPDSLCSPFPLILGRAGVADKTMLPL